MNLVGHIIEQARIVNRSPTEGQKKAGNYQKGHIRLHGLDIAIENPRGSYREGVGDNGRKWRSRLPHHYGYIKRTEGSDGDHVDVFIGPHVRSGAVYVIDQKDLRSGGHDEHKVMMGFGSEKQAREAYKQAFSDGRGHERISSIEGMTIERFKDWLKRRVRRRAEGGGVSDDYNTRLGGGDEMAFQAWKMLNAPRDSGADYDLRGAYQADMRRDPESGHMGDRFKKPNHPTFSDQSQYATGDQSSRAGYWVGPEGPDQTFVPPAALRAAGGRAGYADGGAPTFAPDAPTAPIFAPDAPSAPLEDPGALSALGHGIVQGATMNFGDKLAGARATAPDWMPEMVGLVPAKTLTGIVRAGIAHVTGDKDTISTYEKARDEFRKADEAAKANHSYLYGAGEFAGAVPTMMAMPEVGAGARYMQAVRAAKLARQTAPSIWTGVGARAVDSAVQGGTYGAISGAGEGKDIGERAMDAATGMVGGIIGGAVASPVADAVGAGVNWAAKKMMPAIQFFRDKADPAGAAAARLRTAINADQEMINNGTAKGLTVQQWVAARQAGEPVTLADLGAGNVQALLRSAANTSPEARALLEQTFAEGRFLTQSERFGDTVRNAIPGGTANASKTGDQLVAEYDAARSPLYKAAYEQGDRQIRSPIIDRLMGSEIVKGAMRRAVSSSKDRAISDGFGAFNPGVTINDSGAIIFNKGPTGAPVYPNLQFWDQVKRELDSVAKGQRQSDPERAALAGNFAKMLRTELDKQVPLYENARGVAERYFGESNALEAGRKLAGKKMDPVEVQKIMRQMKPDERALFQEGYASGLANDVIGNIPRTTNLTKGRGVFQSPNQQQVAAAIFGPGGMAQLQARVHLETVMDAARQALGNSTTTRQLLEAGLAGGAMGTYDLYESGGNMWEGLKGLGEGAALGHYILKPAMAAAAKKIAGTVNQDIVRNVAQLLTSNNPRDLQRGLKMVAQNKVLADRMRMMAQNSSRSLTMAGQVQPSRLYVGRSMKALQGPVPAGAGDEQQRPQRVGD